jgi:hypothetical protein
MVTVYHAKFWNAERNAEDITPYKGTLKWIRMIPGDPMLETAQDVSPNDLDGQGRYIPNRGQ